MLTLEDLFPNCRLPQTIAKYVTDNLMTLITNLSMSSFIISCPEAMGWKGDLKFICIPVDEIERYIEYEKYKQYIEESTSMMLDHHKIATLQRKMEQRYQNREFNLDMYTYNEEKIINEPCVITAMDRDSGKVFDIYFTIPRKVLDRIDTKIQYNCCHCNYTSSIKPAEELFPLDMCYGIYEDEVKYFCIDCALKESKNHKLSHVGDSIDSDAPLDNR